MNDTEQELWNTYMAERADLTGIYGYMSQMIGVAGAVVAPLLVVATQLVVTRPIPQWIVAAIPLPLVALAALVTQAFANLTLHGHYAARLEDRLEDVITPRPTTASPRPVPAGPGVPRGVHLTQPVYGQGGKWAGGFFLTLGGIAPIGFLLIVLGVVWRSLQLVGNGPVFWVALGVYSGLGLILAVCNWLIAWPRSPFKKYCEDHARLA